MTHPDHSNGKIDDTYQWGTAPERDPVIIKDSHLQARYKNIRLKRKAITDNLQAPGVIGVQGLNRKMLQDLWQFDIEVIKGCDYLNYHVGKEARFFEILLLCGLQSGRALHVMSVHPDLFPFAVHVPTLSQEVPPAMPQPAPFRRDAEKAVDNTLLNTIGTLKAAKLKARDSLKKEVARIMGEYRTETGHSITSIQIDMILHSMYGVVDDSLVTGIKITTTASEDV